MTGTQAERSISLTVTYLAMEKRPSGYPPPPLVKTAILRAEEPPVHFYRYLYDAVGRDYLWVERRHWNDQALAEMLADENVALYVLYVGGVPAGMAELDFRKENIAQIAYFGLTPEFVGQRIGPWFLYHAIELCWARRPRWARPISKLIVSTCTLDHKKALSTYQRAGFAPYARGEKTIVVPPDLPLPPHLR